MKKIIVIILLVILISGCPKEKHMVIETDASGVKYIKWATPAGVVGLTTKTVTMWVYPDDFGTAYDLFFITDGTSGATNEYFEIITQITTGKFGLRVFFAPSGTGVWITTSATLTAGAWNHIVITYNGSSTTNDPSMFLNGASVAITELTTPVGTYQTGTASDVYIGGINSGENLDGKTASVLVYNRILSPAEVLGAYNSRLAIPDWNGLVFAPNLSAGAGLTVFDGTALAAGNTIPDQVNGYLGVPTGSPVAVSDTFLEYK